VTDQLFGLDDGELSFQELELLNETLNDSVLLREYTREFDHYLPSFPARMLGGLLVTVGNLVYGKRPSYAKFRAIEVIARVPYQSWTSAAYTLLTFAYTNERRALALGQVTRFARLAHDNETMHVVVISGLARKHAKTGFIRHTLIPILFAFFYFWASYILYLIHPRYSYELNFIFENHSFAQYDEFLLRNREQLQSRSISSDFLTWYGRNPRSEYEFFTSVRNDEIIHRNTSIKKIYTL
jgi:ubiquinol oxidase